MYDLDCPYCGFANHRRHGSGVPTFWQERKAYRINHWLALVGLEIEAAENWEDEDHTEFRRKV